MLGLQGGSWHGIEIKASVTPSRRSVEEAANTAVVTQPVEASLGSYIAGRGIKGYQLWAENNPLRATTLETIAAYVVRKAGNQHGLHLGNGHTRDLIDKAAGHPLLAIIGTTAVSPIGEEWVNRRLIPSILKRRLGAEEQSSATQLAEQMAVVLFAARHAGNPFTQKGRGNMAIPITPFLMGEHFQYIAKKRGLGYSIVSHAINNTLGAVEGAPQVIRVRNHSRR